MKDQDRGGRDPPKDFHERRTKRLGVVNVRTG